MNTTFRIISGAGAVSLLAACSGGPAQTSTPGAVTQAAAAVQNLAVPQNGAVVASASALSSRTPSGTEAVTPFVNLERINGPHGIDTFVTSAGSGSVSVWGSDGQLNAILYDGPGAAPAGLTTDVDGDLYVANQHFANVIVYAKPYTSIKRTLNDPDQIPEDAAVSKTGVVAVTNYLTTNYGPGSVTMYGKNATTPCASVSDPKWTYFYNDAFDAAGNLFVDGQTSNGTTIVGEIKGGCSATSIITLSTGNTIQSPGGVQINRGSVLIGDFLTQSIYTYAAPVGASLGSPTTVTALAGAQDPVTFAIEADGKRVRTADNYAYLQDAILYTYPAGSYLSKLSDHVWAIGVAVYPPAKP